MIKIYLKIHSYLKSISFLMSHGFIFHFEYYLIQLLSLNIIFFITNYFFLKKCDGDDKIAT